MIAHKFCYNKQKGRATTDCNSDVAKLIQTFELHTSEMVKMKKQLFRKFKECEKMITLYDTLEKMIEEDGKMIILQEDNKKLSHMITLDFSLEKTSDPPLECKNCEIALFEFDSSNILISINNTNNIFEFRLKEKYKDKSAFSLGFFEWLTVEIKTGCYSIKSLQNYIQNNLTHYYVKDEVVFFVYFKLKDNKAILKLNYFFEATFAHPNSFGKVLGFSVVYNEHEGGGKKDGKFIVYESDKEIASVFGGLINVHLDCVENTYINNQESNLVYSFNQQGGEVNEKPKQLVYFPLKDKITDFKVELKDKNNTNLCFDLFQLKFHIKK